MGMAEFTEIVEQAWRNRDFVPLFRGESGCEADLIRYLPAFAPTDWSYVIDEGIYELYRKTGDKSIMTLCRRDIGKLLDSGDPFSVWCGYCVCFFLLNKERENRAPFSIMDDEMLNKLQSALVSNRERLKTAHIWQGTRMPDGLWTDIASSSVVLERKFGIRLLDKETEDKSKPRFQGPVTKDMPDLLGQKLQDYVDVLWEKEHSLPRAVRIPGMDIPHVNAEYGYFGDWKPERAHAVVSREKLEEIYETEIPSELYEYYRGWRFAAFKMNVGTMRLYMDPLYENLAGQTNFFQSVMLRQELYFKLGTADDRNLEYTVLYKHSGGVYLLEDGTESMIYFAENITALLENVEKSK